MNKTELIAEVAKKCGMSKKDAETAVTTTFDTITEALSQGDKVQLVGFGGQTGQPKRCPVFSRFLHFFQIPG